MPFLANASVVFDDRTLRIVLASGSLLFSLALVVLMVTRWGKAQLVSKCAFLSLLAHMLLVGYAHVTPIVWERSGDPHAEIGIRLVDDDEPGSPSAALETTKPWNAPTEVGGVSPDAQSLARIDSGGLDPERRLQTTSPDAGSSAPVDTLPVDGVPIDGGIAAQDRVSPLRGAGAASLNEAPKAQRQDPAIVEMPEVVDVAKSPLPESITSSPQRVATDVPAELLNSSSRLQRLNEAPFSRDASAALVSELDRPDAARNQSSSERSQASLQSGPGSRSPVSSSNVVPLPGGPAMRPGDGSTLPGVYAFRGSRNEKGSGQRFGGNANVDASVAAALTWLSSNQETDGRWNAALHGAGRETRVDGQDRKGAGSDADAAITALAVLAFQADGQSHLKGKHRQSVQHGLEFLLRNMRADGNLAGNANTFSMMYCHGMATFAVAEAYALTGDKRLKSAVEKAVGYSVASQHPTTGGWRYQPGDQGDMSQFGWQVMALTSAQLGGIVIPEKTKTGMRIFLRSCSSGPAGGLGCYRSGDRPTRSMTAEAMACRYFLDCENRPATLEEAARFITEETPSEGQVNLYSWYYASLALQQHQDPKLNFWHEALEKRLLSLQETSGELAGSWPTNTVWGGYGGRVYTTSMAALCLQSPLRFAPRDNERKP